MKAPRSTIIAERLIFLTALVLVSGGIGAMISEWSQPAPVVRECPRFEVKPQAYPLTAKEQRQFINYYRRSL